jgi:Reverse transcriptase (RNA-dependent DNA polymerase)
MPVLCRAVMYWAFDSDSLEDESEAPPSDLNFSGDRPVTPSGSLNDGPDASESDAMYDNLIKRRDPLARLCSTGRDRLLDHTGDHRQLMHTHERHAALCVAGSAEVDPIQPWLFERFADARTMYAAVEDLLDGGRAPGPNGHSLQDLNRLERWGLCRALAKSVRAGNYRPAKRRHVRIPKGGGRGHRELQIQNVEDRIVDRGLLRILQPVINPLFSPFSFGFRPRAGTMHALATGLALARRQKLWFWVTADIANAFDAIPNRRLLDACAQYLPEQVVQFIGLIVDMGLAQGSPISPFLANIFFHHFLDKPWRRRHPDKPLLRYADDLAVMASSKMEADDLNESLETLALSAGTPLKKVEANGIFDIRGGQRVTWLGFQIQREGTRLTIRIAERAWSNLAEAFAEAHLSSASPIRALQAVRGWLNQIGPCFEYENQTAVVKRIRELAAEAAFEEMPATNHLVGTWQRSHARWHRLYCREAGLLKQRLSAGDGPPVVTTST